MKKLVTTLFLFISLPVLAAMPPVIEGDTQTFLGSIKAVGDIYRWLDSVLSKSLQTTVEPIALYVETTGNDSNDCLTVGTACLTIQEALDRLPKVIKHNVSVTVGEGTFAGFFVDGFHVPAYPTTMVVQGTRGQPTLASGGKTSATADAGGDTITLVDADGGWNVDELRGYVVQIGTVRRPIRSNTANTINLAAAFSSTCSSKAYTILEVKTTITAKTFSASTACIHIQGVSSANSGLSISSFELSPTGATQYGVVVLNANGLTLGDMYASGTASSMYQVQHCPGPINMYNLFATGTGTGYNLLSISNISQLRLFAYGMSSSGIALQACHGLGVFGIELIADSCGAGGIFILDSFGLVHSTAAFIKRISASNNTLFGMLIAGGELSAVGASITGTGNSTYGAVVSRFGKLIINGTPTLTGASGDYAMNEELTDTGTWATDLASTGDSVFSINDGSVIIRR